MKKREIKNILMKLDETEMPSSGKMLSRAYEATPLLSNKKRAPARRNIVIFAAVMLVAFAIVGCAAEVKEYNEAVDFFEANSLSLGDLSRWEIKRVYRDITTKKFRYEKTAVVLKNTTNGYSIIGDEPTKEELIAVWDSLGAETPKGIEYSWYYLDNEIYDEKTQLTLGGEMMFYKSLDGEKIWETKIALRDSFVEGHSLIDCGKYVAAYGTDGLAGNRRGGSAGFIALFNSESGEYIWHYTFDEYKFFSVASVLPIDGGMAVFGRGDLSSFVFTKLDILGNITYQRITDIGNRGIWNVAAFGDGYIMQLGGYMTEAKLYKVSRDGELSDGFSYSSEDTAYFIEDMAEFCGKIYLSAYAVPKHGREIAKGHGEIDFVFDLIYEDGELKTSDDTYMLGGDYHPTYGVDNGALTELLRENYTAVLLVCDGDTGVPEEFYSVSGSVCGELGVDADGNMIWKTHYISDTYFSPATSAFSIGGACYVYEHIFDSRSNLISSAKTGEVVGFYK